MQVSLPVKHSRKQARHAHATCACLPMPSVRSASRDLPLPRLTACMCLHALPKHTACTYAPKAHDRAPTNRIAARHALFRSATRMPSLSRDPKSPNWRIKGFSVPSRAYGVCSCAPMNLPQKYAASHLNSKDCCSLCSCNIARRCQIFCSSYGALRPM